MERRQLDGPTAAVRLALAWALAAAVVAATIPASTRLAAADETLPADRLEQLVAPIALYPDPLLMNMLMGATYPLEIVQADRWAQSNKGLRGEALDQALAGQSWDESVKALAKLPDVVARMSQNLDWTTDLGEAFLAQQADVLDAIQRMRKKASAAGNLQTTKEQQVIVEKEVIKVVPADPQVIYVPTYSAPVVYGSAWSYPSYYYPSMYAYPPGYVATASVLSFGVGVAVGAAVWGSADWHGHGSYCCGGWGGGHNDIDIDRNVNINNVNINNKMGNKQWEHKPEHRRGASYKNNQVRERYRGGDAGRRDVSREQARGFAKEGGVDRAATQARQRDGGTRDRQRPAAQDRARPEAGRAPDQQRRDGQQARKPQQRQERSGGRESAFGGGSGNFERNASARGSQSRDRAKSGGGMRAGGGGGNRGGGNVQRGGGGGHRGGGGGGRRR